MSKKTTSSLLSKIKGNTTTETKADPDAPEVTAEPRRKPVQGGKPAAFWLDETDRAILREFGVMMYAQGIKPSDSLIARAGLRFLPRDHRFMEVVRQLVDQDKRRVRHQKPAEKEG
jgi:hypothetical protein